MTFLVSTFLFWQLAVAADMGPRDVVEQIFAKAGDPAIATEQSKQQEVNGFVDFQALANAALGKNLKAISKKDALWFKDTLQEIIARTVYPKASEFLKDVKINYSSVEVKQSAATVKSQVKNKADFTDVDYRLQKGVDAKWRVIDITVADISWVKSINEQVTDLMKKKKWKGVKDALTKRLEDLKSGKL